MVARFCVSFGCFRHNNVTFFCADRVVEKTLYLQLCQTSTDSIYSECDVYILYSRQYCIHRQAHAFKVLYDVSRFLNGSSLNRGLNRVRNFSVSVAALLILHVNTYLQKLIFYWKGSRTSAWEIDFLKHIRVTRVHIHFNQRRKFWFAVIYCYTIQLDVCENSYRAASASIAGRYYHADIKNVSANHAHRYHFYANVLVLTPLNLK